MLNILMLVAILVMLDFITGYTCAYLQRTLNSSTGLDGLIRKGMVIFSLMGFLLFDQVAQLNLIVTFPSSIQELLGSIGVIKVGLAEGLGMGILLQELTSILENLYKLGVPLPTCLTMRLQKIRQTYLDDDAN